jgi:hypothetical protein
MWLFTKHGFISAVQFRTGSGKSVGGAMLVRARRRDHLEDVLRETFQFGWIDKIESTPKADYAYRVTVPKKVFADIVSALAADIDYPNFKDECHYNLPHDEPYLGMLMNVWSEGVKMQYAKDAQNEMAGLRYHLPANRADTGQDRRVT